MKLKQLFLAIAIIGFLSSCDVKKTTDNVKSVDTKLNVVEQNFDFATKQLSLMLEVLGNSTKNPRSTEPDGSLQLVKSKDWTSGFFPGNLWYLYEYTKDEKWKIAAERCTNNVEDQQFNGSTHDMGFKIFCSYGNGYRLTSNEKYKEILLQSARTLITRFNPKVGCIRSWDHNSDKWKYPVIIDNMMNLELLFWATKNSDDSSFYKIAVSHALTTMKNHYRKDFSTYHVVNYDTITGEPIDKHTHQGYSHESAWSRGQAWSLYGFTMCYRETGDKRFLSQAINVAKYIMNHKNMPEDKVPYWDFDAPEIPNEPRDASAAALISSALFELSTYTESNSEKYRTYADDILNSLSSENYTAKLGENNNFILMHSVGSKPHNSEINVPLVYADYYFLEANLRKLKTKSKQAEN